MRATPLFSCTRHKIAPRTASPNNRPSFLSVISVFQTAISHRGKENHKTKQIRNNLTITLKHTGIVYTGMSPIAAADPESKAA